MGLLGQVSSKSFVSLETGSFDSEKEFAFLEP